MRQNITITKFTPKNTKKNNKKRTIPRVPPSNPNTEQGTSTTTHFGFLAGDTSESAGLLRAG